MAADEPFAGWDWDWEDPDGLAPRMDEFSASLARCDKLEQVAAAVPRTRARLAELGVTGIEFAAFKTAHPSGLGTDLAGLSSEDAATGPGPVYRVDGQSLFTQLDITEPLPLDDGCVDWVYAEHLIEHVPLPAAIGWLAEVRRVLAPAGLVRITTPDLARYIEGYHEDSAFYAKHRRRLKVMRVGPPMPDRRAFMFNQIFYLYGHRWIYDLDELRHALVAAGFAAESVRECAFRQGSRADVAELDTTFRSDETIYVEANA
ncbi:MAG TPA: methyltransferase domain-containing protein [Actinocrinis sp.]|jgi:predicted SAM-dependent methyltransferase